MVLRKQALPALYATAKDAYYRNITKSAAASEISRQGGISAATAGDLVRNLEHMIRGETYKRRLASAVTEYFLEAIRHDFGDAAFSNALAALDGHIAYYEGIANVSSLTDRSIHKRFQALVERGVSAA
jgi:5-methylcytosine-specific restriction protein A